MPSEWSLDRDLPAGFLAQQIELSLTVEYLPESEQEAMKQTTELAGCYLQQIDF